MKTSDLIGPALDWAVAKCGGYEYMQTRVMLGLDSPSTDWSQGGPIIEREEIELHVIPAGRDPVGWVGALDTDTWEANICVPDADYVRTFGPTPLIAAMRCYVASKLGDDIELPEELK